MALLPNELLSHLLSFMPTKDTYTMPPLSEDWISKDPSDFECGLFGKWGHVFIVLRALAGKEIKELVFSTPVRLHRCPFRKLFVDLIRMTLVDIRLDFEVNGARLRFPALKVLKLRNVGFRDRENLILFLRSCSILEEVSATSLWIVNYRVADYAPVVEQPLPHLVSAHLDDCFLPVELVSRVQTLTARLDDGINYNHIPGFANLLHADLIFDSSDHNLWNWMARIMYYSPKLKRLKIDNVKTAKESTLDGHIFNMPFVPECISSKLLYLQLRSFKGSQSEVRFVTYVLTHALLLKTATVQTFLDSDDPLVATTFIGCPKGSTVLQLHFL
ncbi:hypothetical protein TSUD_57920 [Trifolium subterraneum]|uniref:FBD domain-containing protein n=1 Tax=Trifolium subterraneum TaxID=3900 RepID=A0A2Z6MEW3_TRISU|nr:hypothetical protein TSUD_57920 [Trifolium subterraneum]